MHVYPEPLNKTWRTFERNQLLVGILSNQVKSSPPNENYKRAYQDARPYSPKNAVVSGIYLYRVSGRASA